MKNKRKQSKLELAQQTTEEAIKKTNERIDELGKYTNDLYVELCGIQEVFDRIRNVPSDKKLEYDELKKIRLNWKQQAEKIEKDYNAAQAKQAGVGAAGAGLGVAVVALGPTAAMGVATTFGVASTGTAISSLSGAAATNAALAWLGGGAIAAGGGGMAAGEAILALAGPIGWAIAAASLVASGLLIWKKIVDKNHLNDIFTLISERDIKSYDLAIVEINERIARIDDETGKMHKATDRINSFGLDYNNMTEAQQYELGAYVNLMTSATQLLVNPIIGIQPKYTEEDYNEYLSWREEPPKESKDDNTKKLVVCLCNLLYKIDLNERDKKLLRKSIKKNKDWLKQLDIKKKDVKSDLIDVVMDALNHKYDICE